MMIVVQLCDSELAMICVRKNDFQDHVYFGTSSTSVISVLCIVTLSSFRSSQPILVFASSPTSLRSFSDTFFRAFFAGRILSILGLYVFTLSLYLFCYLSFTFHFVLFAYFSIRRILFFHLAHFSLLFLHLNICSHILLQLNLENFSNQDIRLLLYI